MPRGTPLSWTDEEIELIVGLGDKPRAEIRAMLCKAFGAKTYYTVKNISNVCNKHGFSRAGFGNFKPGQKPHPNAGAKGPNITSFKKGQKPRNMKPVGSTRIGADGFVEVKVKGEGQRKWLHAHRVLWVDHFGEIPKGHVVSFKDGDKRNISIDNLELISRAQLMRENTIRRRLEHDHQGITPAIKAMAKLQGLAFQATEKRS
jgi:hypothetical protein